MLDIDCLNAQKLRPWRWNFSDIDIKDVNECQCQIVARVVLNTRSQDTVLDSNSVLDIVLEIVLDTVLGIVLDTHSVLDIVLDIVLGSVLDIVLDTEKALGSPQRSLLQVF